MHRAMRARAPVIGMSIDRGDEAFKIFFIPADCGFMAWSSAAELSLSSAIYQPIAGTLNFPFSRVTKDHHLNKA
jgi:hypothetical protein